MYTKLIIQNLNYTAKSKFDISELKIQLIEESI